MSEQTNEKFPVYIILTLRTGAEVVYRFLTSSLEETRVFAVEKAFEHGARFVTWQVVGA